jgi:hypothetical protein
VIPRRQIADLLRQTLDRFSKSKVGCRKKGRETKLRPLDHCLCHGVLTFTLLGVNSGCDA